MDVQIGFKDAENEEKYLIRDVEEATRFSFFDQQGCFYEISNYEYFQLYRRDNDHQTILKMTDKPFVSIISKEGTLEFAIKVLDFICTNDILSLLYSIEGYEKKIVIKYIGS